VGLATTTITSMPIGSLPCCGRSLQKMYEVLISLVFKTLTSGRLRTLFHLLLSWSVDPDLGVEGGWGWNLSHKALRVDFISVT